ncbi:MAG TPA: tetratricopeptide repeat protein [Candidatus Omnitrophota bacterium]|nr:tetratricopeptide repeat protein [Candidatus Omnitrophota bacterium]
MQQNKPSQPKLLFKQKIGLVLFGLFLFFVLLEIGLRLGGFILLSAQEFRNSQSLKQKDAYRILCLGESTTQGEYPRFLEAILNQRNIGIKFSVIDKGRGGMVTPTIISQLESNLVLVQPDMVVAMMGVNDRGEHIPFEAATTSKGLLLIRSLKTYKLIRFIGLHILAKAKEAGFYQPQEDSCFLEGLSQIKTEGGMEPVLSPELFKKTMALNPKNDQNYIDLSRFLRREGEYSQAEDLLNKAIALNPKNGKAYWGLGDIYRIRNKFLKAEVLYKKALEFNPSYSSYVYDTLGRVYAAQGKFPEAEEAFKKSIAENPQDSKSYIALGWLYVSCSKFPEAEEVIRQIINSGARNFDSSRSCQAITVLAEQIGKPVLAEEYAKKANQLKLWFYNPTTVNNYRKLKEILDRRGVKLVCMQYPMRDVEPLKRIFKNDTGVIFVDNEKIFKEALRQSSYKEYFRDMFAGDFGHCTDKGNRLLATNIANVILKEVFDK